MAPVTAPASVPGFAAPFDAHVASAVLHARSPMFGPVLVGATIWAVALLAVASAVFARRRSWGAALVVLAAATVLARLVTGAVLLHGLLPGGTHTTVEHGLDAVLAGLVLAAVWQARPARGDHV